MQTILTLCIALLFTACSGKGTAGTEKSQNTKTESGSESADDSNSKLNDLYQQENLSIDSSSDAGKYASDIMAFPTTILVDRNGNIVGDPMLGGIDNQDNYDTLMKQIQSVIDADSTNK